MNRSDFAFRISDDAFEYLKVQRCASADHLTDRAAFEANYHREIFDLYETLLPHLPGKCESILDIGSGLGGIDAVLNRHYGEVSVYPLDGLDSEPKVERHNKPFNSREATREFLAANGVSAFSYYTPDNLRPIVPFDLIVSFASCGLHYSPEVYLNFFKACAHPGTVLIFDIRRERWEWRALLDEHFDNTGLAGSYPKFDRLVYAAR